jgi:hypothetical protein
MPFFRRDFAVFALGFGGTPSHRAHFYALLSAIPLFFEKYQFFPFLFFLFVIMRYHCGLRFTAFPQFF